MIAEIPKSGLLQYPPLLCLLKLCHQILVQCPMPRQQNYELALQLHPVAGSIKLDDTYQNPLMDNFQSVVEALPMGLIIAHLSNGQIVYGNPAICQLLSVSAHQLRQQKITDFCDGSAVSQQLISVMFAHQKFCGELCWLKPDGGVLPVAITLQPCVFRNERSVLAVIQSARLENS